MNGAGMVITIPTISTIPKQPFENAVTRINTGVLGYIAI